MFKAGDIVRWPAYPHNTYKLIEQNKSKWEIKINYWTVELIQTTKTESKIDIGQHYSWCNISDCAHTDLKRKSHPLTKIFQNEI